MMANEERLGPNVPRQPDRADEIQRRMTEAPTAPPSGGEALFPGADITRLRNQWTEIQSGFVDEPKSAVKRADALVGEVLTSLSDTFARERGKLESQWDRDGDVTTEDFRVAFRRYRAFFDRLLSI
jgi:hypothetical protein